ncbi:hypothetical protein [Bdellovibrio svalbardensis]|uniref:DUF1570 domain-containing protein n=1 Tax=Bdellovibrio svalbardensis TaxID=2972972 RepID=A0ABT6DK34_9BACT|nr:hypothetical protein [Bdellovibrio svalbardensis]MDG0817215.1 hypothetical protein [Bdellovibrio svalbardensis]
MAKKSKAPAQDSEVQYFIKDVQQLAGLPTSKKYAKLLLEEYPFDGQLLNASRLYRESRKLYLSLGGVFSPKMCSTMRSLSAQDLFKDEIEFSPSASELMWFKDHSQEVVDPEFGIDALMRFNEISLYHEQNHRVLWRLLPPPPSEERDFCRYLNFAESLVVTLDLALGDELGKKTSPIFENLKVIYRSGGEDQWFDKSKGEYRNYLLALLSATYYALELINPEDILKAVDYVLPGQKKMNKDAVRRGLELNELFTRITNPQWQERYWKVAQAKLSKMHAGAKEDPLYMPEDPLDLEAEFFFAHRVFDYYGL